MSLHKSITTFGGITFLSRIFGFIRDILLARYIGAGFVADCFFVAFKLPNLFRRLFAEGAFSAAFVPIFCGLLGNKGDLEKRGEAKAFAEEALSVLLPILLLFTGLMQLFMPWVMVVLAPGFQDHPDKFNLAVEFTRLTFPYLILVSMVSLMGAVLNGLNKFAAAASAPVLLNLTLISSLLMFNGTQLVAGSWLARAVTIGGIVQLIWLGIVVHKEGMSLGFLVPKITPRVKEFVIIMLPAAVGAGAVQLNLVIDIILASTLPDGSLSYLFYADRLNQLPVGVIGVAVGTVLLPVMSRSLSENNFEKANHDQNRAMETAFLLTFPAAIALMVIPIPLISALFERGAFGSYETEATAMALMAYAMGLPAYVLIKVLTPGFFSRKDTKTPVKIAIGALILNTILNLILMIPFKHVGLAMATAISAWVNVGFLYFILNRRGHFFADKKLTNNAVLIIAASLIMGVGIWFISGQIDYFFQDGTWGKILGISILVVSGLLIYGALTKIFGIVRFGQLKTLFKVKS